MRRLEGWAPLLCDGRVAIPGGNWTELGIWQRAQPGILVDCATWSNAVSGDSLLETMITLGALETPWGGCCGGALARPHPLGGDAGVGRGLVVFTGAGRVQGRVLHLVWQRDGVHLSFLEVLFWRRRQRRCDLRVGL